MSAATSESSPFVGKKILVTGGAGGVGKAIVEKFCHAGARVFVIDKDELGLKTLKTEFPGVETRVADLLDWDKTKTVVEELLPLDHLVNNAGVAKPARIPEVSASDFDQIMGVNCRAAFNITQVFASGLIKNKIEAGGTIVNISSLADTVVYPGVSAYCCSKSALTMLTKCSAAELAKHNIRVNCVRPTGMQTAMWDKSTISLKDNAELFQEITQIVERQVMKQPLETSDVAELVYFLSSPQSSKITGQAIAIDCGFTVG